MWGKCDSLKCSFHHDIFKYLKRANYAKVPYYTATLGPKERDVTNNCPQMCMYGPFKWP